MRTTKTDQTGRMPRLILVFAGRTGDFAGFVMHRLIYGQYWTWLTKPAQRRLKSCKYCNIYQTGFQVK